jgi:hypothetical protein
MLLAGGPDITRFRDWSELREKIKSDLKKNSKSLSLARILLDACPLDVLHRFINRSWRFMSTYRKGLNREAVAWAVRKQKQHRSDLKLSCIQFSLFLTKTHPVFVLPCLREGVYKRQSMPKIWPYPKNTWENSIEGVFGRLLTCRIRIRRPFGAKKISRPAM